MPPINNLMNLIARQRGQFLTPGFNPEAEHPLLRLERRQQQQTPIDRQGPPLFRPPDNLNPLRATQPGGVGGLFNVPESTGERLQRTAEGGDLRSVTTAPAAPPAVGNYAINPPASFKPDLPVDPADPLERARRAYLHEKRMERGVKKHNWVQALKDAGLGALAGVAQARGGDLSEMLGAAAGGAAAMGATSYFAPGRADAARFDLTQRPRLETQLQRAAERRRDALNEENTRSTIEARNQSVANEQARLALAEQQTANEQAWRQAQAERAAATEQWNRAYKQNQSELNQAYKQSQLEQKERALALQEQGLNSRLAESSRNRQHKDDEKEAAQQADILTTRAFGPEESSRILHGYEEQIYRSMVTPELEALASRYSPLEKNDKGEALAFAQVKEARKAAAAEAKVTYEREIRKWRNLFHTYVSNYGVPKRGTKMQPNQVEAFAQAKGFTNIEDAKLFLRTLGYIVP